MTVYEVKFSFPNHPTLYRVCVRANSHEEAYRRAILTVPGMEATQPPAIINPIEEVPS